MPWPKDCRLEGRDNPRHLDSAKHAEATGAASGHCESRADLESALAWAKGNDRRTVIPIVTDVCARVPGDADRDAGVPEVSGRESVREARAHQEEIRARQRVGV